MERIARGLSTIVTGNELATDRQLNLFPYYRNLIDSREKMASIRLGNQSNIYKPGQVISITVGWDESAAVEVTKAKVVLVKVTRLGELGDRDLAGESPDCVRPDAVKYVLSSIYRTILKDNDPVTIVRWRYSE